MIKKITLFTIALLSLIGCVKIEMQDYKGDGLTEISFNLDNAVTKTINEGTTLAGNFKVYGYVKPTASVTEGGFIMKDAEYVGTGANIGNPVSGTYYWPKADNNSDINVRFVAYSPVDHAKTVTNNGTDSKPETVTFNVTADDIDNASCIDLLYAITDNAHPTYAAGNPQAQAFDKNGKVALQFKHALAWIQFQGKMSNGVTSCTITSITFSSALNSTGDMTINLRDASTTPTWTNKSGSLNQFIASPGVDLTASYAELSNAVVIPQAVPTSVTITFNVSIQNGDETITYNGRQVTRTINTGNDENNQAYVTDFTSSHKYIYRVNVTADGVEFTITVDNWTVGSENPFLVWDHDATAYVEHFFGKASTQMGVNSVIA